MTNAIRTSDCFLVVLITDGAPGVGTFYNRPDAEAFAKQMNGTLLPLSLALNAPAMLHSLQAMIFARQGGAIGTKDPLWVGVESALARVGS